MFATGAQVNIEPSHVMAMEDSRGYQKWELEGHLIALQDRQFVKKFSSYSEETSPYQ
jgi:hypothetical protein